MDFAKVDALRKRLGISVSGMSSLCGVTRAAYYGWIAGSKIRVNNMARIRQVVQALVAAVQDGTIDMQHLPPSDDALSIVQARLSQ